MTPAMRNRTLPRATPADVQALLDDWKRMHKIEGRASERDRGEFRVWCYRLRQHFFSPGDVFDPQSWSVEDVAEIRKAIKQCQQPTSPTPAS